MSLYDELLVRKINFTTRYSDIFMKFDKELLQLVKQYKAPSCYNVFYNVDEKTNYIEVYFAFSPYFLYGHFTYDHFEKALSKKELLQLGETSYVEFDKSKGEYTIIADNKVVLSSADSKRILEVIYGKS